MIKRFWWSDVFATILSVDVEAAQKNIFVKIFRISCKIVGTTNWVQRERK